MKKSMAMWVMALGTMALTTNGAFAAEETTGNDLEAKLVAARERLEEAAHEVAELSAQVGRSVTDHFMAFSDGPPRRAIIGVQLDPASGRNGAKVKDVSPGGPAAAAGIRANDVIVSVNGNEVQGDSAREVTQLMRKVEPESKVNLRVLRDGRPQDFVVIARPFVGVFEHPMPPPGPLTPDMEFNSDTPMAFIRSFRGEFADMELANLTPQLGRYFGTEKGVLVVRAPQEDSLKLEDGDVILSIDGRSPTSGSHASRILRSYQPGEKVTLRVMRQKKAMNLELTLPEEAGHPKVKTLRTS